MADTFAGPDATLAGTEERTAMTQHDYSAAAQPGEASPGEPSGLTSRRRFLGYLLAAPTLVVAADLTAESIFAPATANAAVPSLPQPSDVVDLSDLLTYATVPPPTSSASR